MDGQKAYRDSQGHATSIFSLKKCFSFVLFFKLEHIIEV